MTRTNGSSFPLKLVSAPAQKAAIPKVSAPSDARDQASENEAKLVQTLLSISKSMRALTGLKLFELGFHNGQDELLFALDETAQFTVSQLADVLSIRPSTVSKMMDRLVEGGFVQRTGDNRDARRTLVQITPAGLEARGRLRAVRDALEMELISTCPGDVEATVRMLGVLATTLKKRLDRHR